MASSNSPSVTASLLGSHFVQQYYHVLQHQPEFAHLFYTASSTMIRVDGESTESASTIPQIHTLVQSLHFSGIEIKTINCVEPWSGGIVVVVSGSVKSDCYSGRRKFVQTFSLAVVQTFFLAPGQKCALAMNDIFHYVTEEDLSGVVYAKDPIDILYIKRKDGETVEDFMFRFTKETSKIPQVNDIDVIKIAGFMHGVRNDQLIEKLTENIPQTFADMIDRVKGFVRGEKACALLKEADTQKSARSTRPNKRKRNRFSLRAASFRRRKTLSPYHPMSRAHSLKSSMEEPVTFRAIRMDGFREGRLVITATVPGRRVGLRVPRKRNVRWR